MLARRCRRWTIIEPTLVQSLVFVGNPSLDPLLEINRLLVFFQDFVYDHYICSLLSYVKDDLSPPIWYD